MAFSKTGGGVALFPTTGGSDDWGRPEVFDYRRRGSVRLVRITIIYFCCVPITFVSMLDQYTDSPCILTVESAAAAAGLA